MKDKWGRTIDYLRLSLTDRCNLRCRYCMPEALASVGHDAVLRYEEMLLICRAALALGIDRFKITNGLLLSEALPDLVRMGIDGINISLDSLDERQYASLTGGGELSVVRQALEQAAAQCVNVKVNAVLLAETRDQILPLAELARTYPVDVRFIELMPIGFGTTLAGLSEAETLSLLVRAYPDLAATGERRGNGPASYYKSRYLQGRIGFIAANTHAFCASCNRLRLTSMGFLKPCLCYDDGVDLRPLVRSGQGEDAICQALQHAIAQAVHEKPAKHCFGEQDHISEHKTMNQIGG